MSHFLFVVGALTERNSLESAQLQLGQELWGLRSALIRDNLKKFLAPQSCGLVYVLKVGICAHFSITSNVMEPGALDSFVRDELKAETKFGFVRIKPTGTWESTPEHSLALLETVLEVPDRRELMRRLNLGMHRLTQDQYAAILQTLNAQKRTPTS